MLNRAVTGQPERGFTAPSEAPGLRKWVEPGGTLACMTDTAKGRAGIPEKPSLDGIEETWSHRWQEAGTYAFDRSKARSDVYSIDTPPPTVSGELHIGHVFSYTHTDTVARFQRMRGKTVFYPMGWDDNGLPTERRVQNVYGVRGDASLPYDPAWTPPAAPVDDAARKNRRPSPGATSSSCARADGRGRAGVRGALAPARALRRLVADLHDDRPARAQQPRSGRSCAT